MNNVGMANMNAMAGPVGAPMAMPMNNGAMPIGAQQMAQQQTQAHRTMLNTYIYDYFVKEGLYDVARAMLSSEQHINVLQKDSPRQSNGAGDDPMDTDSKDDLDKRPADLPAANIPISSDSCFLYEWFGMFWEMLNGHRKPNGNNQVNSYIQHTQQQNRLKQNQQQEMLRQMRSDQMQFNPAMMRNMQNGIGPMAPNKNNLARTAMANNQNNPQAMAMMQQQAKQNQMQRDPSDMDGNRRPASPGSTDNAPSPSKRPRLEGQGPPFNPQQAGGIMANGRPQQQGMPGQQQVGTANNPTQLARAQAATQLLLSHNIDPKSLTPDKFQNFANQPQNVQKSSIATYSQNLQQHHGQQMPNKAMGQPGNPQGQGSPMMQQGPNPAEISTLYNANDFGGMRPGPANGQGGGSNHALQDYQMQLMLLEQQNKKRLMMARQEQDSMGNIPRADGPAGPGGPGGPPGPNGQVFPESSPQGARPGASPNPSEQQMKRGTPQMNPAGIPSPLPADGAQSRGSPNPMAFMPGANMDPNLAGGPQFMNGMNGQMVNAQQMNGGMRPPSSHPGQPFNGQVNPQQMMAARQAQGGQAGPNQMQWQGGPNGAMMTQGPQGQVQGTPQQRNAQMPPPSAPAPGGPANGRTQPSSPATSNAAPPTPQQSNKSAPKKKATKDTKKAAGKKSNANTGATPAESSQEQEVPAPATPITPAQPGFGKNGPNAGAQPVPATQTTAPPAPAPVAPQAQPDPSAGFGMDNTGAMGMEFSNLDFANPIDSNNVLQDFDFDSFLHDGDGGGDAFDFTNTFDMQGGEIATE